MENDKIEGQYAGMRASECDKAEASWPEGEIERVVAAQKAHAMDAMARDHISRATLLREGANAIRAKAGIPETIW